MTEDSTLVQVPINCLCGETYILTCLPRANDGSGSRFACVECLETNAIPGEAVNAVRKVEGRWVRLS